MKKMKKIQEKVEKILIKYPEARNSDSILMSKYLQEYRPDLIDLPVRVYYEMQNQLNVPKYESITRVRRKLQEENEELRAVADVELMRYEEELRYIDYAKK